MDTPIKVFWMLNSNIERVRAQEDMRALNVALCSQGGEAVKAYREALVLEVGSIATLKEGPLEAERDEIGFQELRNLAKLL